MVTADELKEKGNQYFKEEKFSDALDCFTELIELLLQEKIVDKKLISVAHSNRSACYISLNNPTAALLDAEKCIEYDKQWVKGYSRKGIALCYLQRYQEAAVCYQQGLVLDAENEVLLQGLQHVKEEEKKKKMQHERSASATGTSGAQPTSKQSTSSSSTLHLAYLFFAKDKATIFRTFQMLIRKLLCLIFFSYCLTFHPSNYYTFWKVTVFHYFTSIFFTNGIPKWKIEYGISIVQNPSLQYLFYGILFYTSQPMLLAFLPVVLIEFSWLTWYITQICIYLFPSFLNNSVGKKATDFLNLLGKKSTNYETWDILTYNAKWSVIWGCIPQYSSYIDVFVGLTLIFDLLTPQRNFILVLVYWQLMRVRYMLSPQIQATFRKFDQIIMQFLTISYVPKIFMTGYLKLKGFTSRLVQTPDPSTQGQQTARPKCTIM